VKSTTVKTLRRIRFQWVRMHLAWHILITVTALNIIKDGGPLWARIMLAMAFMLGVEWVHSDLHDQIRTLKSRLAEADRDR